MAIKRISVQVEADTEEESQAVMDEIFKRFGEDELYPYHGLLHFVPARKTDDNGDT